MFHIIPTIHTTSATIGAVLFAAFVVLLMGMLTKRLAAERMLLYLGVLMFVAAFLLMSHILVL